MRVLVTGAHGFIGSHTCEYLLARGHRVRGLVSPWGRLDNLAAVRGRDTLDISRADLGEPDSLHGVCDGIDVVIHAAARVADWGVEDAFFDVNVRGTEALLREAERAGVERFVLVSSVAVFRYSGFRQAEARTMTRDGDINAYARSKKAAEDVVMAGGLEPVLIRPGLWPYGPRDPTFARVVDAVRNGQLPLIGGGHAVINPVYVENLVRGLELAALSPDAAGKSYLIADDGMPSWREVFTTLAELLDAPKPRLSVPGALVRPVADVTETLWRWLRPQQEPPLTRYRARLMTQDVHFSTHHAKNELGYRPLYTWQDGLAHTVTKLSDKP